MQINSPLFFLVLVVIDNVVRRCFVVSTQLIAVATVCFEDFLFFSAQKERFRLAFSRDAPLVIHLFVIVDYNGLWRRCRWSALSRRLLR